MEEVGVPLSHPLTGWDQKPPRHVTLGASEFQRFAQTINTNTF